MKRLVSMYLTNRVATFVAPYPKDEITPFVSFYPPGFKFSPKFRMGIWNGKITLLKHDKLPSGLFRSVRHDLETKLGLKFGIEHRRTKVQFAPATLLSDRPYQNECVDAMVKAAPDGGGLVLAATGTGKTYTVGLFFRRLIGTACFIVDELTLLEQARNEIQVVLDEPVGQAGNSVFKPERITVATVQTMHRHLDDVRFQAWTRNLSVMVIDEVHIAMNRRNFDTVKDIEPPAVFGLTATLELTKKPVRLKAYSLAGPVIYEYPLEQGRAEGYLAPSVVCRVMYESTQYLSDDYQDYIVANKERNDLIVALTKCARDLDKYTIVLVERIDHLRRLSQALHDVPHRVVCGMKTVEQRLLAQQKIAAGQIRVILANKVFKKGINTPRVDVIIDAAAMRSKNDAVQKHGRGVRQCEGKSGLIYLDISDTDQYHDAKDKNRFDKAARSRARALKHAGVSIYKIDVPVQDEAMSLDAWAKSVFKRCQIALDKEVAKRELNLSKTATPNQVKTLVK